MKTLLATLVTVLLFTALAHADEHEGPKYPLAKTKAGDLTLTVTQIGDIKPGKPASFEIVLADAKAEPKAVRAWVGVESGKGSVKVKARKTPEFFDADLEVPDPIPADSKLWVEIELDGGKVKAAIDYKK